jgi:hypothetical protein
MGAQYVDRVPLQMARTGGGLFVGLLFLATSLRAYHDQPTRVAITGTSIGAALFVIEAISLQALDRILYRPVGTALLIAWVWLGLAIVIGSAAAISSLRQKNA